MAEAILQLATGGAKRKQFSKNAEEAYHSRFTIETMVNAYMDLYQDTGHRP
jgi:glycosyltransferase involved in cell wall biosynthesis